MYPLWMSVDSVHWPSPVISQNAIDVSWCDQGLTRAWLISYAYKGPSAYLGTIDDRVRAGLTQAPPETSLMHIGVVS